MYVAFVLLSFILLALHRQGISVWIPHSFFLLLFISLHFLWPLLWQNKAQDYSYNEYVVKSIAIGLMYSRVVFVVRQAETHRNVVRELIVQEPADKGGNFGWKIGEKIMSENCLGSQFGEKIQASPANERHKVAGLDSVPHARRHKSHHQRQNLHFSLRCFPVHESEHHVIFEPHVHTDVPVGSKVAKRGTKHCSSSFNRADWI